MNTKYQTNTRYDCKDIWTQRIRKDKTTETKTRNMKDVTCNCSIKSMELGEIMIDNDDAYYGKFDEMLYNEGYHMQNAKRMSDWQPEDNWDRIHTTNQTCKDKVMDVPSITTKWRLNNLNNKTGTRSDMSALNTSHDRYKSFMSWQCSVGPKPTTLHTHCVSLRKANESKHSPFGNHHYTETDELNIRSKHDIDYSSLRLLTDRAIVCNNYAFLIVIQLLVNIDVITQEIIINCILIYKLYRTFDNAAVLFYELLLVLFQGRYQYFLRITKCCNFDKDRSSACDCYKRQGGKGTKYMNTSQPHILFSIDSITYIYCKCHGIQKTKETLYDIGKHEPSIRENQLDIESAIKPSALNSNTKTLLFDPISYKSLHLTNVTTRSDAIDSGLEAVRAGENSDAGKTIDTCQTSNEIIFNKDTTFDDASTELFQSDLPPKLIEAYSYARKPSTVQLQNDIHSVKAQYNILDLKYKDRIIQRNYTKVVEIGKAFQNKYKHKHDDELNCRDSYVEDLRDVTWLPLDMLPVPKVEIDVRRIEFDPLNTILDQLARDENPGPHITMRYELLRFCTLRNYPKRDKPYLNRISGAGFYFAAEGDELVCYCCGMRKSGWTELDKPMEIHKRLSPRCSFLVRNEDVNVPVRVPEGRPEVDRFAFLNEPTSVQTIDAETTESSSTSSTIERVSSSEVNHESPHEYYMSPVVSQELRHPIRNSSSATPVRHQRPHGTFSYSSNSRTEIATTTSQTSTTPRAAATRNPQPKHPNYSPRSVRVASFQGWPDDLTQTPDMLADAGFYYAGIADCVRCYFCGLGLRHWSEEDNPWIEHARWSRPCLYVKMIKGEEFINLVHLAVQYTENERTQNEEQQSATASGETNTEHEGRQIPIDEINRLLRTDAAQSVLDMGYQPDMIKKAIEKVLIRDGRAGVSSTNIMAMIFEIEEEEAEAALTNRVNNIEISNDDNRRTNANVAAASSTVNAASEKGIASTNTTAINNNARQRNRPISSSLPTNQNTVATRSTATETSTSLNSSTTTNSITGKPQAKTNSNKKDAKTVKKENERMKMQTMCQICKNNSVAIVFLPCGHLVTCETCAPTLRNCPMPDCKTIVKGTVKAFMT